jgi:hypothetical protein
MDPYLFFAPEDEPKGPRVRREREAKRICGHCPVIDQCRRYAFSAGEPYGVWGGTSELDRRTASTSPTLPRTPHKEPIVPIGHVVTFTFAPNLPPATVTALGEALDALSAASPGIDSYRHGPDLRERPGNADYAVAAVFRDQNALAAYMASPEHQRIITELVEPHLQGKSSVQFPIVTGAWHGPLRSPTHGSPWSSPVPSLRNSSVIPPSCSPSTSAIVDRTQ